MRVLLISHTCQSPAEGQPKCELLHATDGINLRVLVPDRWKHYGRWRKFEKIVDAAASYEVGHVRWPWAGPGQFYLHWYPQLRRLLQEFRPDIIDLWEEPWGLVSAHACYLRGRLLPGTKIISETEQNILRKLPPPFQQFRRYVLQRADFVVGRNRESLNVVRACGYSGPAEVVPNAVDDTLFRPLNRAACREKLGVQGFVAGYFGRLVEQKGLGDLIAALPQCPPEVNVLLVGDGPIRGALAAQAEALQVAGRVHFEPGVPLHQLPELFNALDVFVLPSHTMPTWKEQFGRVIIESHACGVPVIGSDSGAIAEVIGEGGLVFPERNPAALAAALVRMAREPELRQRAGVAGRRQVEEYYTWKRVAERMAGLYQSVTEGPIKAPVRRALPV